MLFRSSYTDLQGTAESVTSDATTSVINVNDAPTGGVSIFGTVAQNSVLTADTSTLADLDGLGTIKYQWLANGSAISEATGSTYTLTQGEVGKAITVQASYTDLQGTVESVTSDATTAVVNVNDLPTGYVLITGTAIQGQTLTASNTIGDIDGLGAISYQWLSDGTLISGVTGPNYTLGQTDVGKAISVNASYIDGFNTTENVTSSATSLVIHQNNAPNGGVSITGIATQNAVLFANVSTLTDLDGVGVINYQWLANGSEITGATGSSYTLSQSQVGKSITVKASYVDGYGTNETVVSPVASTAPSSVSSQMYIATNGDDVITGYTIKDCVSYYSTPKSVYVSLGIKTTQNTHGSGNDKLIGIEDLVGTDFNDSLLGDNSDNLLCGGLGNDTINGGMGNDTLIGGLGNDRLTGGKGADIFLFDSALGSTNKDTITDFLSHVDKLQINSSLLSTIGDLGQFSAHDQRFWLSSKGVAHDATDRLIYNSKTGALSFDSDGNGPSAPVTIEVLGTLSHPSLVASDIYIV